MPISAPQCRAARALLDWSQDDLAKNASVARATIADFEAGVRLDIMRQNMISIISTLEAGGVEFLAETQGGAGAGVRHREVKLEHTKEGRLLDGGLVMPVKFGGTKYQIYVVREVLDDLGQLAQGDDGDRVRVAEGHLGLILRAAEVKLALGGIEPGSRVALLHRDFPDGTF